MLFCSYYFAILFCSGTNFNPFISTQMMPFPNNLFVRLNETAIILRIGNAKVTIFDNCTISVCNK